MSKVLSDHFSHIKVSEFPQTEKNGGKVITVPLESSLKEAMNTLNENRIYSAPVYDKETSQYVGMVDMGDIVDFIAENFEETQTLGKGFEAILEQADKFVSAKVLDVIKASQRTTFVPISGEASMLQVSLLFKEHGVHRVNVFDKDEKLVNIITKSAVAEQLHKHHELLADIGQKTPIELNLGTSPVISIDISEPTIKAFQLLRSSRLYAVPVVNKQLSNAIVATISAKDVRDVCFDPSRLHLLYNPISKFLATSKSEAIDIGTPSVTCKDSDPLKLIIDKLVVNKIHRVYVLEPNTNAPKKAISLTDILNCLI
jgi:CBS domain-containing protein